MLSEAAVEINGLTVIAGENDTGKSTVGKTFFSVVKAISRAENDLDENKEEKIRNHIWSLYRFLQIRLSSPEIIESFLSKKELFETISYCLKNNNLNPALNMLDNLNAFSMSNDVNIERQTNTLKNIITESNSKQEITKRALQKALNSTFLDEFCNKKNKNATIQIIDEYKLIFDAKVINNKVESLEIYDELFFNDSTYIETPFILDLSEQIRYSMTSFDVETFKERAIGRGRVSLRVKDLVDKLSFVSDDLFNHLFADEEKNNHLQKILNGHFQYDRKKREFVLKKDHATFKSINVASGLKCFGILQMLNHNGFLDNRSLLILDEPEVHLHPKWQLAYAQVIIDLIKEEGLNVVVNSHSPYMIEALKRFAEKENINANYYLAEDGKIIRSDDSLEKIFEKLSEPFVTFDDMDAEKLNG
jgi:ABC-type multidrug transport system ATPase subunit